MAKIFENFLAALKGAIREDDHTESEDIQNEEEDDDSSDSSSDYMAKEKAKPKKPPKVDNSWKRKAYKGTGIRMEFKDKEDSELVNRCPVQTLPMDDRHLQLALLSEKDEFLASEMFTCSERELEFREPVTVCVRLVKKVSKYHKVKVKIMRNGKWTNEKAEVKSGEARFTTRGLDKFAIIGDLVQKKVKLQASGDKFNAAEDSRIEVTIPSGAVDSDVDVELKIIPPDSRAMEKYLREDKPFCKAIIEVTECLYIDLPPSFEFNQPVTIGLPFENRPEKKEGMALVVLRMSDGNIDLVESPQNLSLTKDSVCTLQVSSFSGYFAGHVRADQAGDRLSIIRDARLLFGKTYIATILTFVEKEKLTNGYPRVWIELVDKMNVIDTVVDRTQNLGLIELPLSRSPDVIVFDGYRLHIEISGHLQGLRGIPKGHYFITYLDVADDNHRLLSVEERKNATHRIGIINFYNEKALTKTVVHSLQFDTVEGIVQPEQERRINDHPSIASEDECVTLDSFHGDGRSRPISQKSISIVPNIPALQETSLYTLAEMVKGNGHMLAVHLGMSEKFETTSQSSLDAIGVIFTTLKLWVQKHPAEDTTVVELSRCLRQANLKAAAKAFDSAVKKNSAL